MRRLARGVHVVAKTHPLLVQVAPCTETGWHGVGTADRVKDSLSDDLMHVYCLYCCQVLYKRVCEYLELTTRVEVLNNRFGVLQEMLDMLRDEQNRHHQSRLEWIVIWLIVLAVSGWSAVHHD